MLKRLFDISLAVLGLIIFLPLFLTIAIWIKLDSPGPVFFRQERVGRGGKHFQIFKFRTMISEAESKGLRLTTSNDSRITSSGRFLRKTKLDELPQMFNIIKSEMSFVGPRPEVPEYVKFYSDLQKEVILSVRPGITDEASIKFRNENELLALATEPQKEYIEVILPQKLSLYMKYVEKRSFWVDLKIIFSTVSKLI